MRRPIDWSTLRMPFGRTERQGPGWVEDATHMNPAGGPDARCPESEYAAPATRPLPRACGRVVASLRGAAASGRTL
jgi:hypothetical protein